MFDIRTPELRNGDGIYTYIYWGICGDLLWEALCISSFMLRFKVNKKVVVNFLTTERSYCAMRNGNTSYFENRLIAQEASRYLGHNLWNSSIV